MIISVAVLAILVAPFTERGAWAYTDYSEASLDQLAEESRPRGPVMMRPPPDIYEAHEQYLKKYGERKNKRKHFYDEPAPRPTVKSTKQENRPKDVQKTHTRPVTNTKDLPETYVTKEQHRAVTQTKEYYPETSFPNRQQSDRYRVATASLQVLPQSEVDGEISDWMPIVPVTQPDFYKHQNQKQQTYPQTTHQTHHYSQKPQTRQIYQTKHYHVEQKRPQRQIYRNYNGFRPIVYPRYRKSYTINSPYKRSLNIQKMSMNSDNSSGFSGTSLHEQKIPANKEMETSETHHVEYKTKIKHHHHHHHHKFVETVIKKIPVKVPYKVIVPKPYPVEKKVPYPVEKIVHKYIEKKVPYPVEKKVPYKVEVKVPQPYPVKVIEKEYVPKPYPVIKHVQVVKHVEVKVPVPHPVPYPVEKKVPYPVHVKVPYPVEKKVPYPVEVEKKVHVPVKIYVPKPYPVEKKVPYPVEVKVKEPYPVIKHVHVPVKVYVDKPYPVHIPKPYPVEVEKKVPYPVEVEKKVPIPVKVYVPQPYEVPKPYPVFVEKEHKHSEESEANFSAEDFFGHSF